MPDLSPKDLSELIGSIYDCVLEPERWREVLDRMGRASNSPSVALAITETPSMALGRIYDYGMDPAWVPVYERLAAINPMMFETSLRPEGDVIALSQIADAVDFYNTRFYLECLKPFRQRDAMAVVGLRSGKRFAFVALNRTDDEPLYTQADIDWLSMLAPHITRTLKISDALDLTTLGSTALEATLDTLSSGVILLDRADRIVHLNSAAERHLSDGSSVKVVQNRIVPNNPKAAAEFSAGLLAVRNQDREGERSISVALPVEKRGGLIANLLRLDRGCRQTIMAPFAAVTVVFLHDSKAAPQLPGEAFAKLYGLTSGELRVAMALAPGLGIKEASELLGISEATVKSHLQRLFFKTGTNRQAEFIQLLHLAATP